MSEENLVERMKHNRVPWFLLRDEERRILLEAGTENCLAVDDKYGGRSIGKYGEEGFWKRKVYQLKADYQPGIKWLTKEYIKEVAQISLLDAIEVSLEHHKQVRDAGLGGFRQARIEKKTGMGSDHCGLCYRFRQNVGGSCTGCPLLENAGTAQCCAEWRDLRDCLDHPLSSNEEFLEAENRLIARLEKELELVSPYWVWANIVESSPTKEFHQLGQQLCSSTEKSVTQIRAIAERLQELANVKLSDPDELTYHIGQRVKIIGDLPEGTYIIAKSPESHVSLINLETGNNWYRSIKVKDPARITQEEMNKITVVGWKVEIIDD